MSREHEAEDRGPNPSENSVHDERADGVAAVPESGEQPVWRRVSRRQFIATSAATGAGAMALPVVMAQEGTVEPPFEEGDGTPQVIDPLTEEQDTPVPERGIAEDQPEGFSFFTPFQAAIVAAAAAVLIPSDEHGPGAMEAGVVYFIDRQLRQQQHFTSFRGPRYGLGPFIDGEPAQGDQSALDMQNRWRLGIEGMESYAQEVYGQGFAALSKEQQETILRDMEAGVPETFGGASIYSTEISRAGAGQESSIEDGGNVVVGAEAFFQLLHAYTLAGFFSDPVHGGNRDMVGWKLIGFPGAQGFVYHDWILRYGEEFDGGYKSLAEYQDQFTGED